MGVRAGAGDGGQLTGGAGSRLLGRLVLDVMDQRVRRKNMRGVGTRLKAALWRVASGVRRRWRRGRSAGIRGERAAARWLAWRGYEVLGRNVRLARIEADLVLLAPDGKTLVIVEVKTLADDRRQPVERVDATKRRRLERFAALLLRQPRHRGRGVRFDIVGVRPGRWRMRVQHLPGAWRAGE